MILTVRIETRNEKELSDACSELQEAKINKLILVGGTKENENLFGKILVASGNGEFLTVFEIKTMIKKCYSPLANESEIDLVNRLANLPVLVICDVIFSEMNNDDWFCFLLDKRHARNLPTVIFSYDKPKDNYILSRCENKGKIVEF